MEITWLQSDTSQSSVGALNYVSRPRQMSGFVPVHEQLPSVDGEVNNFVHGYGIGRNIWIYRCIKKEMKTPPCLVHDTPVPILDGLTHFQISRAVSDLL